MRLKNKVAIVTGAASGIGKATALRFAAEGAKVVIVDIDREGSDDTLRQIKFSRGEAIVVYADLSQKYAACHVVASAIATYGRIDILVNCAAMFMFKGLEACTEDWLQSFSTNVLSAIMMSKHAALEMKKTGGGSIVMLGSISSFIAQPGFATYSMTKASLVQLARNLAQDLAPFGIRVNSVCPGPTRTPASARHAQQKGLTAADLEDEFKRTTMLGRMAEPDEVAAAILFLASDEASYITGAALPVDGGYTAI